MTGMANERERLDQVEEHIKKAEEELDEVEHPYGSDDGQPYYESGDTPEHDDQTIAPPG